MTTSGARSLDETQTALTIFDAVIAWLTYREYRKQLAVARR
jgi:hypothetical protein